MILGAIAGDTIGSRYEFFNTKNKDFQLFSGYCNFTDENHKDFKLRKKLIYSRVGV